MNQRQRDAVAERYLELRGKLFRMGIRFAQERGLMIDDVLSELHEHFVDIHVKDGFVDEGLLMHKIHKDLEYTQRRIRKKLFLLNRKYRLRVGRHQVDPKSASRSALESSPGRSLLELVAEQERPLRFDAVEFVKKLSTEASIVVRLVLGDELELRKPWGSEFPHPANYRGALKRLLHRVHGWPVAEIKRVFEEIKEALK